MKVKYIINLILILKFKLSLKRIIIGINGENNNICDLVWKVILNIIAEINKYLKLSNFKEHKK